MDKKVIIMVRVNEYMPRDVNKNVPFTPDECRGGSLFRGPRPRFGPSGRDPQRNPADAGNSKLTALFSCSEAGKTGGKFT